MPCCVSVIVTVTLTNEKENETMGKKIFAIILALIMCIACFAACGNKKANETDNPKDPVDTADDTGSGDDVNVDDTSGHAWGEWLLDKDNHWQICDDCGAEGNKGKHEYLDDVCTFCMTKRLDLDRVDESGNKNQAGTFIKFGQYPQRLLTAEADAELITTLNQLAAEISGEAAPTGWTLADRNAEDTEDIMWYLDVESGDAMYRGVYYTKGKNHITFSGSYSGELPYQEENKYAKSTVYWFKYEPIIWQILEESNGEATLISKTLLDAQDYYSGYATDATAETIASPNNYQYSTIRAWLNPTFMDTAFDQISQSVMKQVTVDNSASSTLDKFNQYASENTTDYVYLLSAKDLETYALTANDARVKTLSDYAKIQGAQNSTTGAGNYWLRSPLDAENSSKTAYIVDNNGASNQSLVYTFAGVAPVIRIAL